MTKSLRQINEQFSSAGQPTVEDLQQLSAAGFKSVLNLRTPGEVTVLTDEQQQAEAAGLVYGHVPLSSQVADDLQAEEAIKLAQQLPKPLLVHCAAGGRATAIALLAIATAESWPVSKLIQEAEKLNLSLEQPQLQAFLQKQTVSVSSIPDGNELEVASLE